MISDEALEKIYKSMRELSDDDIFGEERSIDPLVFNNVIEELIEKKQLDSEDLLYQIKDFSISERDLLAVYYYIRELVVNANYESYYDDSMFTEEMWLIQYKDTLFTMREINGQGTIIQFSLGDPYGLDKNIKVLKFDDIDNSVKFRM